MDDEFDWIQPNNLLLTANAIAYSESKPERKQYVRIFMNGLAQRAMFVFIAAGTGAAVVWSNKSAPVILALL